MRSEATEPEDAPSCRREVNKTRCWPRGESWSETFYISFPTLVKVKSDTLPQKFPFSYPANEDKDILQMRTKSPKKPECQEDPAPVLLYSYSSNIVIRFILSLPENIPHLSAYIFIHLSPPIEWKLRRRTLTLFHSFVLDLGET